MKCFDNKGDDIMWFWLATHIFDIFIVLLIIDIMFTIFIFSDDISKLINKLVDKFNNKKTN